MTNNQKPPKGQQKGPKPGFSWSVVLCPIAFLEGLLFAYFTHDMFTENMESIADNQSYVDDLKGQFGEQTGLMQMWKKSVGEDVLWWLAPTWPELKINYYERVWSKKEVRKMH